MNQKITPVPRGEGRSLAPAEPAFVNKGQLSGSLSLVGVDSPAGSVYVTVEEADWTPLDERERMSVIQEMGRTAKREGISGLLLRAESGMPLAQWHSERGAALIEHHEPRIEPALPAQATESSDTAGQGSLPGN